MKLFTQVLTISSCAILGSAAPLSGVAGATGTVGNVVHAANAVSVPSSLPTNINTLPDTVLDAVTGILSGTCSIDWKCSITLSGTIQSLLVDGDKYTGQASVSAWCDGGRCYGASQVDTSGTAPFVITCDEVPGSKACSGTVAGAANVLFANGKELEVWGWMTPSGYCSGGTCYASLNALGDPMY